MISDNLTIAMIQDRPGTGLRSSYIEILKQIKPDIIAFPEYYFVGPHDESVLVSCVKKQEIIQKLKDISSEFDAIIVGGSVVEQNNGRFVNRSYLVDRGTVLDYYDKIHPYDNEGRGLIKPGTEYKVIPARGIRIGILICADVLYPSSFSNIRGLRPDFIFVPTTSPYRANESKIVKYKRDQRIFADGAERASCLIFKVCASEKIARHRLQARSLVASPGNIEWRIQPEDEDKSALVISRAVSRSGWHHLDTTVYRD